MPKGARLEAAKAAEIDESRYVGAPTWRTGRDNRKNELGEKMEVGVWLDMNMMEQEKGISEWNFTL